MALTNVVTSSGMQLRAPTDIYNELISNVSAENPGYTANLPGSMIDDISGTEVAGITLMDQARVDAVNSVSPYTANPYVTNLIGVQMGIPPNLTTNGSVYVTATGTVGWIINQGFILTDGVNQYILQETTAIPTGGTTSPMYFVTTTPGTFAIPAGTVTEPVSAIPSGVTVSFTNPNPGTPGNPTPETIGAYRGRLWQAQQSVGTGMTTTMRTNIQKVPGVTSRLVAIPQVSSTDATQGLKVIVGGGDPYQVGAAIFNSMFDMALLHGSSVSSSRNVTVSIVDTPDTYTVTFIAAVQQTVAATITWKTTATNVISNTSVQQVLSPVAVNYINSVPVTQPINLGELESLLRTAINPIVPSNTVSFSFSISINGTVTPPTTGTELIPSDVEGYFFTQSNDITVTEG